VTPVKACGYVPTSAPAPEVRACLICRKPVHAVPTKDRRDYHWADESGSIIEDKTPQALIDDPKKWWDDLAKRDIATYSSHKAAVELACFSWWHVHQPGDRIGERVPCTVPQTCGQPMWAGPDGWVCRVHGEVFPYAGE